jgi:hypothetical protein
MSTERKPRELGSGPSGVTPLSSPKGPSAALPAPGSAVARLSLFGLVMTTAAGCVDPPPQYSAPDLMPPVIIGAQVDPPTATVTNIPAAAQEFPFTVPFRADDGGQEIVAWFVRDLDLNDVAKSIILTTVYPPGDPRPFAEQLTPPRSAVAWTWKLPEPRPTGCHTVTMILSRINNYRSLYLTKDETAAAQVTWFLNILGPSSDPLKTCWPGGGP